MAIGTVHNTDDNHLHSELDEILARNVQAQKSHQNNNNNTRNSSSSRTSTNSDQTYLFTHKYSKSSSSEESEGIHKYEIDSIVGRAVAFILCVGFGVAVGLPMML